MGDCLLWQLSAVSRCILLYYDVSYLVNKLSLSVMSSDLVKISVPKQLKGQGYKVNIISLSLVVPSNIQKRKNQKIQLRYEMGHNY